MKSFMIRGMRKVTLVVLLAFSVVCAPFARVAHAFDKSKGKDKRKPGAIFFATDDTTWFFHEGKSRDLGHYVSVGEVDLIPGVEPGSLDGSGVAVVQAGNGDQIVGVVSCTIHADGKTDFTFHWRDSVQFSDGTVLENTGEFITVRPPGLVVIAIIAVLIGLLLPAIQ